MAQKWSLLLYTLPRLGRQGRNHRVAIWRRLRQIGAQLVNDGAWILPSTPNERAQLQQMAAAIVERGGIALVFDAELAGADQVEMLKSVRTGNREPRHAPSVAKQSTGKDLGF